MMRFLLEDENDYIENPKGSLTIDHGLPCGLICITPELGLLAVFRNRQPKIFGWRGLIILLLRMPFTPLLATLSTKKR
jgi:hypothetical protein